MQGSTEASYIHMMKPSIYVIIVTFNMLDGLSKTLESVRRVVQSNDSYQCKAIVINGNPHDSGWEIVSRYPDVVYKYIAESDSGHFDAMNKGIKCLPDDGYAIFINSDDELIRVPEVVLAGTYEVVFCNILSSDSATGLREEFRVYPKTRLDSSNLLRPRIHHQGCFVKSSVLKMYRYDINIGIRGDVLLMGTLLRGHKVEFCNEIVASISTGGKSDQYTFANLASFFSIANELGISKWSTVALSLPEICKYSFKGMIGTRGIEMFRRVKRFRQRDSTVDAFRNLLK